LLSLKHQTSHQAAVVARKQTNLSVGVDVLKYVQGVDLFGLGMTTEETIKQLEYGLRLAVRFTQSNFVTLGKSSGC
jgi:4'-phosphopantetheinyl transferase EntD